MISDSARLLLLTRKNAISDYQDVQQFYLGKAENSSDFNWISCFLHLIALSYLFWRDLKKWKNEGSRHWCDWQAYFHRSLGINRLEDILISGYKFSTWVNLFRCFPTFTISEKLARFHKKTPLVTGSSHRSWSLQYYQKYIILIWKYMKFELKCLSQAQDWSYKKIFPWFRSWDYKLCPGTDRRILCGQ